VTPRELVDSVMSDPPQVHAMDGEHLADTRLGVYSTSRRCYELMAEFCTPESVTLETGCGISTVLLTTIGATHTSVVGFATESDRMRKHLDARGIVHDRTTFAIGWSDEILPTLAETPLDLVLIDGGHGFPTPIIDWYYAAGRLRQGGLLIIDDVNLPAVAMLVETLDKDPRWTTVESDGKWVALRRESEGGLREDWFRQPYLQVRRPLVQRTRIALGRVRQAVTGRGESKP
jgi:precorrin-6B methylase 2